MHSATLLPEYKAASNAFFAGIRNLGNLQSSLGQRANQLRENCGLVPAADFACPLAQPQTTERSGWYSNVRVDPQL